VDLDEGAAPIEDQGQEFLLLPGVGDDDDKKHHDQNNHEFYAADGGHIVRQGDIAYCHCQGGIAIGKSDGHAAGHDSFGWAAGAIEIIQVRLEEEGRGEQGQKVSEQWRKTKQRNSDLQFVTYQTAGDWLIKRSSSKPRGSYIDPSTEGTN